MCDSIKGDTVVKRVPFSVLMPLLLLLSHYSTTDTFNPTFILQTCVTTLYCPGICVHLM